MARVRFSRKQVAVSRSRPSVPWQIRTCPRVEDPKEAAKTGVGCRLWFAAEQGDHLAFDYRRAHSHMNLPRRDMEKGGLAMGDQWRPASHGPGCPV
jgi:hypothetical protein